MVLPALLMLVLYSQQKQGYYYLESQGPTLEDKALV